MITDKRNRIFDSSYTVKPNGCWEWNKYISKYGYPYTTFRKSKEKSCRVAAHRYSYERYKGRIPSGMNVCHNCPGGDNRACVNPEHLWIGTHLQNNRDKKTKGTQCRGVTSGLHKLEEEEVRDIMERILKGEDLCSLAKEYNVSTGLISHIKNGRAWKHIIEDVTCERARKLKRNHPVKLDERVVRDIRLRYSKGERVTDLAKEFGVATTMISRIHKGKAWKHIL